MISLPVCRVTSTELVGMLFAILDLHMLKILQVAQDEQAEKVKQ